MASMDVPFSSCRYTLQPLQLKTPVNIALSQAHTKKKKKNTSPRILNEAKHPKQRDYIIMHSIFSFQASKQTKKEKRKTDTYM